MKRLGSSDSMGALISMCANAEESGGGGGRGYGREFQAMLMEGLEEDEGAVAGAEKKRRLSVEQVKALEKNFEMENKLEPERKLKLATELGLQPRQVAVWFQNRRARWKTKQLERDYGVMKASFDALKHNYDALLLDNESLLQEIRAMKSKLYGEDEDSDGVPSSSRKKPKSSSSGDATEMIYGGASAAAAAYFPDSKDGSSDSDSSAVLNDGNRSPNLAAIHSRPASPDDRHRLPESSEAIMGDAQKAYQPQFVKIEEHNFFGGDEPCNFFSDEQAPTLQWYCQDQWNMAGAGDDNN